MSARADGPLVTGMPDILSIYNNPVDGVVRDVLRRATSGRTFAHKGKGRAPATTLHGIPVVAEEEMFDADPATGYHQRRMAGMGMDESLADALAMAELHDLEALPGGRELQNLKDLLERDAAAAAARGGEWYGTGFLPADVLDYYQQKPGAGAGADQKKKKNMKKKNMKKKKKKAAVAQNGTEVAQSGIEGEGASPVEDAQNAAGRSTPDPTPAEAPAKKKKKKKSKKKKAAPVASSSTGPTARSDAVWAEYNDEFDDNLDDHLHELDEECDCPDDAFVWEHEESNFDPELGDDDADVEYMNRRMAGFSVEDALRPSALS